MPPSKCLFRDIPCELVGAALTLREDPNDILGASSLRVACTACLHLYEGNKRALDDLLPGLKLGKHDRFILRELRAFPVAIVVGLLKTDDRNVFDARRRSLKKLGELCLVQQASSNSVCLSPLGLLFCSLFGETLDTEGSVRWSKLPIQIPPDDVEYRTFLFLKEIRDRYRYREVTEVIERLEQ